MRAYFIYGVMKAHLKRVLSIRIGARFMAPSLAIMCYRDGILIAPTYLPMEIR